MFKKIDPQQNFPKLETEILDFWNKSKIFQKSLENRKKAEKFIFYDGPPFANGLPHYGHILAMTIKDTVTRFKTMEGYLVPRRGGWDTHGLPVEFELEKELGISGKPEIEKYGVEKFNQKAKESVFKYRAEWEKTIERMGRWIDWKNAYTTMDRNYMESVWWVFSELYKKGFVYQGYKSLPYCPRCGTPLSNFETNQGYKDNIEDPSVYIKFRILDSELKNSFLLAWTTTPWTLPGNTALAINTSIKYVLIKNNDQHLILAKDRLSVIDGEYDIVREIDGQELIGKTYEPLYDFSKEIKENKKIYQIFPADFVSTKDGTGIIHVAPAFGEDDLSLAQKEGIALVQTVDSLGNIKSDKNLPGEGKFVKDADFDIMADLEKRHLLYKRETIRHTYPFCWRCETPLLYYAMNTWFVKVSEIRDKLTKNNEKIHWVPKHIKEGRFGKWLAEARDWSISRNRYWGAPIPIWQCQKCQKNIVIGSINELSKLSGQDLAKIDLHKPSIDEIEVNCSCGGKAKRIPEVFDCWFESGSMPYASEHYPFENEKDFNHFFPADFIAEGLDQTRGWFYTLHVLAAILFDSPAFKNVIVNGIVLASDGKKLSKRLRNYDEPQIIFDGPGVDALRYFLLSSTPMGEDYRFSTEAVKMEVRKVLLPLRNTLSFLTTYANIDGWKPLRNPAVSDNVLDKWISSKINQAAMEIKKQMDIFDLTRASRQIEEIIIDLSQWYLRRSRKREDKENFYQTLYFGLKNISIISAPFIPFCSEEIYQTLKTENDPESVHLCDWPKAGDVDEKLISEMAQVRNLVELAHAQRAENKLKVRQPLAGATIKIDLEKDLIKILKEEINVKEIIVDKSIQNDIELDTKLTPVLLEEGKLREMIRQIQDTRKKAGLNPGDKVKLTAKVNLETRKILEKNKKEILLSTNLLDIVILASQSQDLNFEVSR
jgi:isoleucyl-tRNA synthetase